MVSPGTLTDAGYLDAREPAFLMAISPHLRREPHGRGYGVALLDLSTGEFDVAEYSGADGLQALRDEIAVLRPREIVRAPSGYDVAAPRSRRSRGSRCRSPRSTAGTSSSKRRGRRCSTSCASSGLDGFGLERRPAAVAAAGALVRYLRDTQKADLAHVRAIACSSAADAPADRSDHAEAPRGRRGDGGRPPGLAAGRNRSHGHARWAAGCCAPGCSARSWRSSAIRDRLDAVEELAVPHDRARQVPRHAQGGPGPRAADVARARSARPARATSSACARRWRSSRAPRCCWRELQAPLVRSLRGELDDLTDVRDWIEATLVDEPPALARDGGFIRDGVDAELDDLRTISRSGKQVIAEMEERERARTGITSLKIRFNRVFGYYIEISKSNLHAVPADYHRKQTIAGGERFITPALKEYEEKVLGADERILERELAIFEALRRASPPRRRASQTPRARSPRSTCSPRSPRPPASATTPSRTCTTATSWSATDARHPVVERAGGRRVRAERHPPERHDAAPARDPHRARTWAASRPTCGRSRCCACWRRPDRSCRRARPSSAIVDRIFARVGASDNIARGQSTFMVEMQETANILQRRHVAQPGRARRDRPRHRHLRRPVASPGRWPSTWPSTIPRAAQDAVRHALPRADRPGRRASPGVVNSHVAAREWKDDIIFLRKIVPGRSDRSYGIQVARLAGLPAPVVARAREILHALERDELSRGGRPAVSGQRPAPQAQLGLFQAGRRRTNGCAIACARWTSIARRHSTRCSCCRS